MAETTLLIFDGGALIPDELPIVSGDAPCDKAIVQNQILAAFDDTDEEAAFTPTAQMPASYAGTGTLKATLQLMFASATSGGCVFDVSVEAVTPGDSTDLDAGRSFDSVNSSGDIAAPGTAGYLTSVDVTLTNKDSVAAGDHVVFHIRRDTDNANDDASGDVYVTSIRIHEDS